VGVDDRAVRGTVLVFAEQPAQLGAVGGKLGAVFVEDLRDT
jgi:hypothetical protein